MKDKQCKERLSSVIKSILSILVLGIAYYIIIKIFGLGIPCVFRLITGYKCPGCGMTHAAVAVLSGHIYKAFEYNALSVSLVPVMVIYGIYKCSIYIKTGKDWFRVWEIVFLIVCLVITVLYGIYRNI